MSLGFVRGHPDESLWPSGRAASGFLGFARNTVKLILILLDPSAAPNEGAAVEMLAQGRSGDPYSSEKSWELGVT